MKDLTIAGHKISKVWLIGGAAGGVIVFVIIRRARSGGAGTSSADQSGTDPLTGLPYSMDNEVDPATGLTYLEEAQQYGSVAAAQAAVSGTVEPGGTGDGGVIDTGGSAGGGTSSTSGSGFTTNAQWAQAVTTGLVSLGYSAQDVSSALGLYFQSQPLGTASDGTSYLAIVQAAVAEFGAPPVGSYPITGPPTSGGAGGGTGGTGGTGTGGGTPPVNTGGGGGVSQPPPVNLKTITAKTVAATGTQDLQAVATSHGTTEDVVELMNPALAKKWAGTGKDLPKGTSVRIPSAAAAVVTAPGGEDLQKVANGAGITEESAIALNPGLAKYAGSGTYLPAGTKLVA